MRVILVWEVTIHDIFVSYFQAWVFLVVVAFSEFIWIRSYNIFGRKFTITGHCNIRALFFTQVFNHFSHSISTMQIFSLTPTLFLTIKLVHKFGRFSWVARFWVFAKRHNLLKSLMCKNDWWCLINVKCGTKCSPTSIK